MKSNWFIRNHQTKDIVTSIIRSREIKNRDKFLQPTLDKCHDPRLLSGARKAAGKILSYVQNNEKIAVFGHDDVDGITSTVLIYSFLKRMGAKHLRYYIPNREYDKFGLQNTFVNWVLKHKTTRLITVDIGITETEPIAYLRKKGIKTIILDHHKIMKEKPLASAIVNPHKKHDRFPFKFLAGVGVVYNVVKILAQISKTPIDTSAPLLAGLGTIADRMPLMDDNRIFAKHLYYNLDNAHNPFLRYFMDQHPNTPKEQAIRKIILLLTIGRDENGKHQGVELLIEDNIENVKEIYHELENRLHENEKIVGNIQEIIQEKYNEEKPQFFICCDESNQIPSHYLGVATSYITDTYKIPSLILAKWEDDVLTAECRAPSGFNWLDYLKKISSLLIQYGGHKEAAGFTCHAKDFPRIKEHLLQLSEAHKKKIAASKNEMKNFYIDYVLDEEQFNTNKLREVNRIFSPFGQGNPQLLFLMIDQKLNILLKRGFKIPAEIEEGLNYNIVFSIVEKEFVILDFELATTRCENFY